MIRALPLILLAIGILAGVSLATRWTRRAWARRPGRRGARGTGAYEFDRRIDRMRRRAKRVPGAEERRDAIVEFLDTHTGVEAYVEPKTVISPRSVVLVDGAGEWRRYELREDAHLRRLARERGVPIFDAARTGYPSRMRRRPGPEA